jgi:glycosyltransferase involved in cell wall biosynthesis
MRILFISEYFTPKIMGGGEINLFLIAKALVKNGEDVSVLTSDHPGLKRVEIIDGIKIYRKLKTADNPSGVKNNWIRSRLFPKSIVKETKKLNKKLKFDLIHFIGTSIIAAKELRKIKRLRKVNVHLFATIESYPALCPKGDRFYHGKRECKSVCSFSKFLSCQMNSSEIGKTKNSWYLKYNLLFLYYVYNYYKKLNEGLKYCKLIAISEYVQKILLQQGRESVVIPNMLEVNKFNVKINKKKNKSKKTRILYLGSLTKFKGPQVLLKAIKGLNNVRCNLYGDGPLKEELQRYINKNNLDAEIYQPVSYDQIPEVYANHDLVVFPSIWPEPFGRIAIEAMAAGKPVIGSDVGGIRETIEKGKGILVKLGDNHELKKQILNVIENEALKKFKINGTKDVKDKYSELNVIKKIIKRYQEELK